MVENGHRELLVKGRLVTVTDLFRQSKQKQKGNHQKYRTHAKMILDFLKTVQRCHGITAIMKEMKLPSYKLEEILDQISRTGLVTTEEKDRKRFIDITEKGQRAIKITIEFLEITGEL